MTALHTGEPATISVEAAAKILGIGRNQAYQAAARGEIPCLRIGRRFLIPRAKLLEMLGEPATPRPAVRARPSSGNSLRRALAS